MGTPVTPGKEDIYEEDIGYRGSVSEELLRKFAASINAINKNAFYPLGAPISSFLPEAKFQVLTSTAFVLCQGQDITTTDYGQFLINQGIATAPVYLPDLRGMHLVGVNNGRSDGNQHVQNPTLGGFIQGQVKAHTHSYAGAIATSSAGGTTGPSAAAQALTTGSTGQTQNTVNAIGVNWFVKVWDVPPT